MPGKSRDTLKRYLRERRRELEERPRVFHEYLESLSKALPQGTAVILFGGRAIVGPDSTEPRDYDILIVVESPENAREVEEIVYNLKPRKLPADIIVAPIKEVLNNTIAQAMLRHCIILHDPQGIAAQLCPKTPEDGRQAS